MNIELGIFFLSQVVILVVLFFAPVFEPFNNLVCGLFFKKERKLWEALISNVDDFHYETNCGLNYRFSSDKYNVYVWVWEDGYCSIHKKGSRFCVLSSFDKRMSMKMAELLMNKIQKRD